MWRPALNHHNLLQALAEGFASGCQRSRAVGVALAKVARGVGESCEGKEPEYDERPQRRSRGPGEGCEGIGEGRKRSAPCGGLARGGLARGGRRKPLIFPATPPAHFAVVSPLSGPISRSPSKLTYEVEERNFAIWGNVARNTGFRRLCTLICWKRRRQLGGDRAAKRAYSAARQHDRARQLGATKRRSEPADIVGALLPLGRRCCWDAVAASDGRMVFAGSTTFRPLGASGKEARGPSTSSPFLGGGVLSISSS